MHKRLNSHQNVCRCDQSQPPFGLYYRLRFRLRLVLVSVLSLVYNEHLSRSYVFDTLMEPAFWFVDSFAKILGPLFVLGVVFLKSSVVAIAYIVGLPYYWEHKNPYYTIGVVIFGQFFFINVVFHYWMALKTEPGLVPRATVPSSSSESSFQDDVILKQVTSICKKCITPKPPRTHHCSVCNRCVLKMDHHCPWINGCIGHFNHRYFLMYMTFTVLGCLYIMAFGFEIIYFELFPGNGGDQSDGSEHQLVLSFFSRRTLIIYEAFITTGTFLLLGGLTLWHAKLISKGETSIEAHINRNETKRLKSLGQVYKNPFDFTPYYNWCLFLGLTDGRGLASVLFPSKHKPKGDGLTWDSIYGCDVRWNDDYYYKNIDVAKMA